jgi:hypothetical protein
MPDKSRASSRNGDRKMATKKADPKKTEKKPAKVKVTGFAPMKFKDFTITQKTSGRFAVENSKGKNVNGEEKVKLLLEAKVLKGSFKKAPAAEATAAN